MDVRIEVKINEFRVYVNNNHVGTWTYMEGAIEAARKEIISRYASLES